MSKHYRMAALMASGAALAVPSALARTSATVRADATTDPKAMFEQINQTLNALREKHEEGIKDKVSTEELNALTEPMNEHISNLQASMESMQKSLDAAVKPANVVGDIPGSDPEYISAFKAHMRKGDINAAMSIGSDPDGGYLAPVEWDRSITEELREESPIRANSEVMTISGQGFKRLYMTGAPGSGWVGETAARPQTTTPQLSELNFGVGEIYANPAITQQALDDAAIDLEAWLGGAVRDEFSKQENIAFLSGDGVNKPHGLLTYLTGGANQARHPFGAIETGDAPVGGVDGDTLIDFLYGFKSNQLTPNSKWFMNRATQGAIRTLKDANGNYIWQAGLQPGQPSSLLSYPIVDIPGMAVPGAGNTVALFGDMRRTYLVIDRIGVRVMRDPYTNKPYVHFYTTKRVGGGVQDPQYMKGLVQASV